MNNAGSILKANETYYCQTDIVLNQKLHGRIFPHKKIQQETGRISYKCDGLFHFFLGDLLITLPKHSTYHDRYLGVCSMNGEKDRVKT